VLSPQARANLRLAVKPIALTSYWRTIRVPGVIVERPGRSDLGVTTSLAGVVQRIAAFPGDTVRPGDGLFIVRLISESLLTSQTELYRTVRDLDINQEQLKRLQEPVKSGALPGIRLIELEQQQRRLEVTKEALRQDLKARGLTAEHVRAVEDGRFVTEITIGVPDRAASLQPTPGGLIPVPGRSAADRPPPAPEVAYEVEELKVNLGTHVQAGQTLCTLAHHGVLFIEGRGFRQEIPLLSRTAEEGWPVRVEFTEGAGENWPPLQAEYRIDFLAPTTDAASQTFPFYLTLPNQSRTYQREEKTYRVWRFRPGQRVRLRVTVERFDDVFVLPTAAVAREGPNAYVFRANGDRLDRVPVHVLYEDSDQVVVANDGSIVTGNHVAHNAAAQINRALEAQVGGGGHEHHHHDH
jgi:biotin carboxyl carrier protein